MISHGTYVLSNEYYVTKLDGLGLALYEASFTKKSPKIGIENLPNFSGYPRIKI